MTDNIRIFEVGGSIRDMLLGKESKDRDFCAVAPSWDALLKWCETNMSKIFLVTPEFFTVRGFMGGQPIDIVLCRKDGASSDGRHPDEVTPGTLDDDLRRRDFAINAMAIEVDTNLNRIGELIDRFGGQQDIQDRVLSCVGNTRERLQEDGLRLLRAARFILTKNVHPDEDLQMALETSVWWEWLQETVSTERIREELQNMFRHDTVATIKFLSWNCSPAATRCLFSGGLWLKPHLGKK
tara:strand:+ start:42 stop:758 length:717 start_codon:yes stop_codon:yes gene_type:complete